jgi:cell division septal protein FtsQ
MNKVKERELRAAPPQYERQSRWETILNLGIVVAWHKSNLDKECFQRDSAFISMP